MTEIDLKRSTVQLQPSTTQGEIRAWMQAILLVGLSVYFAYNIYTGNLANYINERFVWLSYVATGLFLILGVTAGIRAARASLVTYANASTMSARTWGVISVSAIPLALGVLVPSNPLGADAVNGNISTRAVSGANQAAFAIAPENRNVLDWLRTFNDSDDYTEFNGQPVNVIGFVYKEPDFADNEFMVARFTMSCCVADASALGLPINAENVADLNEGEWVQVTGQLQVNSFGEDVMPVVRASDITRVDQPEHPYLYP